MPLIPCLQPIHVTAIVGLCLFFPTLCMAGTFVCDDGVSVCPEGNVCCPTSVPGISTCVSGRFWDGDCCNDSENPLEDGTTGCATKYRCSTQSETGLRDCEKAVKSEDDDGLPDRLPRYLLTPLPSSALEDVFGFPVSSDADDMDAPQLAYVSSMSVALDTTDTDEIKKLQTIDTLLIMVHGSARNAEDYLLCANEALPSNQHDPNNPNTTSLTIAPWFLTDEDPPIYLINRVRSTPALRWEEFSGSYHHTWRYGADAYNTGNSTVSSYATIDAILQYIVKNAEIRFPSLRKITIAGHSAGGQFTQRWSLLTNQPKEVWEESWRLTEPIRVVVANPKSFCYLDARRFFRSMTNNDTLVFRYPNIDDIKSCATYNSWNWGFTRGGEMITPYKNSAIIEAGGKDAIIQRYSTRRIVYLSGEEDTKPNGYCQDQIQGSYRRERSERYFDSLPYVYGGRPIHQRRVVHGVHHDHCLMFQSDEGFQALFGNYYNEGEETSQ